MTAMPMTTVEPQPRQSSHIIQKDHLLHRCKEEKGGHAQKTVCVPPLQDVQNNDDAK